MAPRALRRVTGATVVATALVLGGCSIGGLVRPPQPPSPEACLRQLRATPGVRFRNLPERIDGPGCRLSGAIQLLDVGVPVGNLGPVSCPVAAGLVRWLREDVQPAAVRRFGQQVTRIDTFGSYACRTRNNRAGALPSEHATGNAVDVAAFRLANGRRVAVTAWNSGDVRDRSFLRDVHRAGCSLFRVALGPDADALHYNHLHLDMGRSTACR